jgi:hypothetical protein
MEGFCFGWSQFNLYATAEHGRKAAGARSAVTGKCRWYLAASISLPLIAMTIYLLWIWPRPHGTSALAQVGPYLLSLLTGLPFVWGITGGPRRGWLLFTYLCGGFVLLWIYALAVHCGVRGVCL